MHWVWSFSAFGISLLVGSGLLPLAIRFARRYDLMDRPSRHKRHKRPVPILGGAAMFISVWVSVGVSSALFPDSLGSLPASVPYVFSGALIVFLVGLSDDLSPVSAWVKLLAQVGAGLILCLGGLRIEPLTVPFVGAVSLGPFSILVTVLWVVGLSNAVNLIDGLDGLAAGVSLIGALTLAVIGNLMGIGSVVSLAMVLVGFLTVFLYYNRYPARIFLGDSGALQLDYYFAVISLLVPIRIFTAAALYLPLLTLGVPLLETAVSISRRLATGRSVMRADRRHLFHYLSLAGLSPRTVVIVFYILSVVFGLFAVAMIYWNRRWLFAILFLFMVVILSAFYILITNLHRFRKGNADQRPV